MMSFGGKGDGYVPMPNQGMWGTGDLHPNEIKGGQKGCGKGKEVDPRVRQFEDQRKAREACDDEENNNFTMGEFIEMTRIARNGMHIRVWPRVRRWSR